MNAHSTIIIAISKYIHQEASPEGCKIPKHILNLMPSLYSFNILFGALNPFECHCH
jgi:hypothetical protein